MKVDRGYNITPPRPVSPEGKYCDGQRPFEIDGVLMFPSAAMRTGISFMPNGDQLVQLDLICKSMLGNHLGIFVRMTAEGARELAGFLLANAKDVEAHLAEQTEAARGKGQSS